MFLHGILQIKRTYAIMPVGKTIRCVHSSTAKTPQSSHLWGVFIPFWRGGLDLRLATSCYFPSSHLQMQQAITLAKIESINDKIISIYNTPPFCTCLGVVAQLLYHRTMCTERLYLKYILGQWCVNSNYVTIKSVIIISL